MDDRIRTLARASKLRDWTTVDAVIEDMRLGGNISVMRGFGDARRALGEEQPLPRLAAPDPVLLLDLPSRDNVKVVVEHGTLKWKKVA